MEVDIPDVLVDAGMDIQRVMIPRIAIADSKASILRRYKDLVAISKACSV